MAEQKIPSLKSVELNGNGKPMAIPGWYKHSETGAVIELHRTPEVGTPMIDAFIQAGFVYAGETDPRLADKQAEAEAVETAKTEAEVVSEPDTDKSEYTESVTKNGNVQYRKNGKLISKEEFLNK